MLQKIHERHLLEDGKPAGGITSSIGLAIAWQDGPLGRGEERQEPNGAFVETVIKAALGRLQFYQQTEFACDENAQAMAHLNNALGHLERRSQQREDRGVEGTHEV